MLTSAAGAWRWPLTPF